MGSLGTLFVDVGVNTQKAIGQIEKFKASLRGIVPDSERALTGAASSLGLSFQKQTGIATAAMGSFKKNINQISHMIGHYLTFTIGVQMVMGTMRTIKTLIENIQEFERAAINATTVSGHLGQSFDRVLNHVKEVSRELGRTTIFTAQDTAKAFYNLASSGIQIADVGKKELIPIMNYAAAVQTNLEDATYSITVAMKQFGLTMQDTARIANTFVAAITTSYLNAERLREGMKYLGPVMGALGREIEEAAAVLGALANQGLEGAQSGRYMSFILARLLEPTEKAKQKFADLGITLDKINPELHTLSDILFTLKESGFDAARAASIFGTRSAKAAIAAVKAADEVAYLEEKIRYSGEIAQHVAEKQLDSLYGSTILLKSAMQEMGLSLEGFVVPLVRGFADFIREDVIPAMNLMTSGLSKFTQEAGLAGRGAKLLAGSLSAIAVGGFGLWLIISAIGTSLVNLGYQVASARMVVRSAIPHLALLGFIFAALSEKGDEVGGTFKKLTPLIFAVVVGLELLSTHFGRTTISLLFFGTASVTLYDQVWMLGNEMCMAGERAITLGQKFEAASINAYNMGRSLTSVGIGLVVALLSSALLIGRWDDLDDKTRVLIGAFTALTVVLSILRLRAYAQNFETIGEMLGLAAVSAYQLAFALSAVAIGSGILIFYWDDLSDGIKILVAGFSILPIIILKVTTELKLARIQAIAFSASLSLIVGLFALYHEVDAYGKNIIALAAAFGIAAIVVAHLTTGIFAMGSAFWSTGIGAIIGLLGILAYWLLTSTKKTDEHKQSIEDINRALVSYRIAVKETSVALKEEQDAYEALDEAKKSGIATTQELIELEQNYQNALLKSEEAQNRMRQGYGKMVASLMNYSETTNDVISNYSKYIDAREKLEQLERDEQDLKDELSQLEVDYAQAIQDGSRAAADAERIESQLIKTRKELGDLWDKEKETQNNLMTAWYDYIDGIEDTTEREKIYITLARQVFEMNEERIDFMVREQKLRAQEIKLRSIMESKEKVYRENLKNIFEQLLAIYDIQEKLYGLQSEEPDRMTDAFAALAPYRAEFEKLGYSYDEVKDKFIEYMRTVGRMEALEAGGITIEEQVEYDNLKEYRDYLSGYLIPIFDIVGTSLVNQGILSKDAASAIFTLKSADEEIIVTLSDLESKYGEVDEAVKTFIGTVASAHDIRTIPFEDAFEEAMKIPGMTETMAVAHAMAIAIGSSATFVGEGFEAMGMGGLTAAEQIAYLNSWMGTSYESLSDLSEGEIIAATAFMTLASATNRTIKDFDTFIRETDGLTGTWDTWVNQASVAAAETKPLNIVLEDLTEATNNLTAVLERLDTILALENLPGDIDWGITLGVDLPKGWKWSGSGDIVITKPEVDPLLTILNIDRDTDVAQWGWKWSDEGLVVPYSNFFAQLFINPPADKPYTVDSDGIHFDIPALVTTLNLENVFMKDGTDIDTYKPTIHGAAVFLIYGEDGVTRLVEFKPTINGNLVATAYMMKDGVKTKIDDYGINLYGDVVLNPYVGDIPLSEYSPLIKGKLVMEEEEIGGEGATDDKDILGKISNWFGSVDWTFGLGNMIKQAADAMSGKSPVFTSAGGTGKTYTTTGGHGGVTGLSRVDAAAALTYAGHLPSEWGVVSFKRLSDDEMRNAYMSIFGQKPREFFGFAEGGILNRPMFGIGESGPEAVIPLDRLYQYVEPPVIQLEGNGGQTYYFYGDIILEGITDVDGLLAELNNKSRFVR